jgi:predicted glycosyltransferase
MNPNNIVRYNGTCEVTHLEDFVYNENILEDLNLNIKNEKIIFMRPEPSLASYLDADCTKSVLTPIVDSLKDDADILILPRFKTQGEIFKDLENVHVLKTPVDTFSLMKKADLVIGAGGTMNREAALLGTPVISCYPGKQLSVDTYYINKGLMKRSTNLNEIIELSKELLYQKPKHIDLKTDNLIDLIVNQIYTTYAEYPNKK